MDKLIEFLLRETPAHAKELKSDIGLLLSSIDNTQSAIEGMMSSLDNSDYSKLGEYYAMAQELKKIKIRMTEIEKSFGSVDIHTKVENCDEDTDEEENVEIEKLSYDECKVDSTIPHGLFEKYKHTRPIAFTLEGKRYSIKDWRQMLRIICEVLCQRNPVLFNSFATDDDLRGTRRNKQYFANSDSGMNDGQKIAGSNIYVEFNQSADTICTTVRKILEKYDIPSTAIQIYLRADYTPRNEVGLKKN